VGTARLARADRHVTPVGPVEFRGRWLIWSYGESPTVELWSSRDATHWVRLRTIGLQGGMTRLASDGRTIVAMSEGSRQTGVFVSSDAVHWKLVSALDVPQPVGDLTWVAGHFVAVTGGFDGVDSRSVWVSADGARWGMASDATPPPRLASLTVPNGQHRVFGIQYETAGVTLQNLGGSFGGRLFSSPDGVTWSEVTSFHRRFPLANPDHVLRSNGWWILTGNTGTPSGQRQTDIWTSRDLTTWRELPAHLRGKVQGDGGGWSPAPAAGRHAVVAVGTYGDGKVWIWNP
jgi:hypothetical protein